MRKLVIFCLIFAYFCESLNAQPGFNRIYDNFDSTIIGRGSFSNIYVDQDTIIAIGRGRPPGNVGPQGIVLAKIDTFGNLVGQNFITDSLNDFLTMNFLFGNIIKTSKGYFAFPATALGRGGHLLIQIDNNLQVKSVFEYPIGDDITEFHEQTLELPDGGFFIVGKRMRPNYKDDGFVRRIDKSGNVLWFKYYGDYNKDESFRSIAKVSDNKFVISGGAGPNSDDSETARAGLWAIDSNGVVLDTWLGPEEPDLIVLRGILTASDGGFIAHGRTYWGQGQWGSKVQISLLKFDSTLHLQWLKHIGPSSSNYNGVYDMTRTPDGHYIVAGQRTHYGDLALPSGGDWGGWLYKFSEQGDSIWARADNAPAPYDPAGQFAYGGVGILSSGSVVAGGLGTLSTQFVGWVVKVSADGCLDTIFCNTVPTLEPPLAKDDWLKVWPNPADEAIQLEMPPDIFSGAAVTVYNLQGQTALRQVVAENQRAVTLQTASLPGGVYFVEVRSGRGAVARKKIVVAHRR